MSHSCHPWFTSIPAHFEIFVESGGGFQQVQDSVVPPKFGGQDPETTTSWADESLATVLQHHFQHPQP